jgi:hypothetical protein
MSFFSNLLDKIRMVNQITKTQTIARSYMFGVILSGTYSNWKTDPHPTILCLGCYANPANGSRYVHGIQLHAIGGYQTHLVTLLANMKKNGIITNPYNFYNYLKMNYQSIIKMGYRTYKIEHTDFRIVNPGLTNIQGKFTSDDNRDTFLNALNPQQTINKSIDINTLKENITRVINTVKIW